MRPLTLSLRFLGSVLALLATGLLSACVSETPEGRYLATRLQGTMPYTIKEVDCGKRAPGEKRECTVTYSVPNVKRQQVLVEDEILGDVSFTVTQDNKCTVNKDLSANCGYQEFKFISSSFDPDKTPSERALPWLQNILVDAITQSDAQVRQDLTDSLRVLYSRQSYQEGKG